MIYSHTLTLSTRRLSQVTVSVLSKSWRNKTAALISSRYNRSLHTSPSCYAKSSNSKESVELITKAQLDQLKPENSATYAYKYFDELSNHENPILTSEYKQLPDDSQFIDKHYNELIKYRDLICGVGGQFGEISDVPELFLRLSKVHPRQISSAASEATQNDAIKGSAKEMKDTFLQMQVEQFDQFVIDLMNTLKLNGGHLFVLDLLIYNKQVFDHCEKTHHSV